MTTDHGLLTAGTPSSRTSPLAWALFLGVSWTWVIGMFLPALLVRDYGVGAWVIFAVPNVVGAAAMGWVLRTREASAAITANHVAACRAFSVVTIAFHLYFAAWYLPRLVGGFAYAGVAVLTLLAVGPTWRGRAGGGALVALAWAASLAAFGVLYALGELALPAVPADTPGLWWPGLAVVCAAGFVACPYFDLTFHQARRDTNVDGAKIAFGVGFGVVFCSMIVFTLAYTGVVLRPGGGWPGRVIGAHILLQSAVTVWLHRRALDQARIAPAGRDRIAWAAYAAALAVATFGTVSAGRWFYAGLEPGEVGYRLILGFYGLLFPAYAWLCLAPGRTDRKALGVFVVAVLVAMPFFWIAFVERRINWAAAGIAVIALARVFVRGKSEQTSINPHTS